MEKKKTSVVTFQSVEDIYTAKSAALREIRELTQSLSQAQLSFHPASGRWSIGEIVEHLCIVEDSLLRLITTLLKRTEDAGKMTPKLPSFEGSFQSALDRSQTEKYTTKEKLVPSGKMPLPDALRHLEDIQTQFVSLKYRFQSVDLTYANFPHWIFGPLNLAEWLVFIGLHETRHLIQIETITKSPEFPHPAVDDN